MRACSRSSITSTTSAAVTGFAPSSRKFAVAAGRSSTNRLQETRLNGWRKSGPLINSTSSSCSASCCRVSISGSYASAETIDLRFR